MKPLLLLFSLVVCAARAQQYSIDWYSVAGGAALSTNGQYAVTATLGQPNVGAAMSGGSYALTGGFWSLATVVPTPGAPPLAIRLGGGGTIVIAWPAIGNWTLQQSADLSGGWAPADYAVSTANGLNNVTLTNPGRSLFFRLVGLTPP